jgi:NADH dehydrogenase/NADH:ubiquinone oxidoreductase subunit G
LKLSKGSQSDVLKALAAAIVKLGLAKNKTQVTKDDLKSLSEKTGLLTDDYLDAAFAIASSEKPVIVYKNGIDLALLKSFGDLINAKLVCLKGNANSLAASQLDLEKSIKLSEKQAIFVESGDEDLSQKMIKEFEKVPFKVVQAAYATSLTSIADVVLPSTNWFEQEGHYLSSDGRMQLARRSIVSNEEILTPFETLGKIAEKLDLKLSEGWTKEIHSRISTVEITK